MNTFLGLRSVIVVGGGLLPCNLELDRYILVKEMYGCFSLLILRVYIFHLSDFYINVSIPLLIPYQLLSAFRTRQSSHNAFIMILQHLITLSSLFTPILATYNQPIYSNITTPSYQTPNFTSTQLYNLTNRFLQNHMYPLNIAQSLSINSSLLSPDILGRVDATRNYAGRELNTEYLFGLFANIALNPDAFTLLGYPVNYTFTRFLGSGNVVSFAAVVEYLLPVTKTKVPQELDFWVSFNERGEISQYDG
jgi:hypothetical protein